MRVIISTMTRTIASFIAAMGRWKVGLRASAFYIAVASSFTTAMGPARLADLSYLACDFD